MAKRVVENIFSIFVTNRTAAILEKKVIDALEDIKTTINQKVNGLY